MRAPRWLGHLGLTAAALACLATSPLRWHLDARTPPGADQPRLAIVEASRSPSCS